MRVRVLFLCTALSLAAVTVRTEQALNNRSLLRNNRSPLRNNRLCFAAASTC